MIFQRMRLNRYRVTSEGQSGGQTQTVRATLNLTGPFTDNFVILTRNTLILKNNSNVYGYNSSDLSESGVPVNVGTLGIQDNSVVIGNNGQVNGNIYIGPDGDLEHAVDLGRNTDVTGEQFIMPEEYSLPTITPPDYVASQGTLSGENITLTSSDSGKYTSITIKNNGKLSIDGDVTLYVTGDIELENNGEIEIDHDGSLKLYFDGDFSTKNNAGINNLSQIPANAMLFGTGLSQDIQINNKNTLYGVIYAPNANMTVFNQIDIYGSYILDNFELKNSAEIYYDRALKEVSLDDEGIRFSVTRWEEL